MDWNDLENYPIKELKEIWLDYFTKPYESNSKAFFCIKARISVART